MKHCSRVLLAFTVINSSGAQRFEIRDIKGRRIMINVLFEDNFLKTSRLKRVALSFDVTKQLSCFLCANLCLNAQNLRVEILDKLFILKLKLSMVSCFMNRYLDDS